MEGNARPDMWGNDDEAKPHVFVENKFWAGLTDNQPVSYLHILAKQSHPTVLLVVVPEAREQTVWRELRHRLEKDEISAADLDGSTCIVRSVATGIGPILALTSWTRLLSFLEFEVADDQSARSDLLQLRALCEAVDSEAFLPISPEEASDQRTPALILQLSSIWKSSVNVAVTEGVLNLGKLMPQADASRIGRYSFIGTGKHAGLWIGIHFGLWKKHGLTPLWTLFYDHWEGATGVRTLLEPWAAKRHVFATHEDDYFAVSLDIAFGEDKDEVVRGVVNRLREIADVLSVLKPKPTANLENE